MGIRIANVANLGNITRDIHCWFKLTGQNGQNMKFQTLFFQIGLRLDRQKK